MKFSLFIGFCLVAVSLASPVPGLLDGLLSGVPGLWNGLLGPLLEPALKQVTTTLSQLTEVLGGLSNAGSPALTNVLQEANATLTKAQALLTQAQTISVSSLTGPAQIQLAQTLDTIQKLASQLQESLGLVKNGGVNAASASVDVLNGLTGSLNSVLNNLTGILGGSLGGL